ncbi:alpha/beta hydrolase family esterase [Parahaliea maris]|uniref:alpha/beta hydrolase family esterase n=1 Tax=Parahaliea maris TaxID=2716870 RepID=UPI00164FD8EA|nr:alpha/beta hydrolase-fold protein [Parahaliea maris]
MSADQPIGGQRKLESRWGAPGFVKLLQGIAVLLLLSACSDGSDGPPYVEPEPEPEPGLTGCADTSSCAPNPPLEIGAERPAQVLIPSNYDPGTRYPLIVTLHGYGAFGSLQSSYLGLDARVDSAQYVLVSPDGTENRNGTRFWNGTPACCAAAAAAEDGSGEDYSQIDDVGYIRSLIEEAAATYSIDPSRVALFGHSNGGFLALRLGCEASDLVTSIVSLAGSTFAQESACAPAAKPVSLLAVHGTADDTILYDGGEILGEAYPSAQETARRFAVLAGCDGDNPGDGGSVDVVGNLSGAETRVQAWPDCPAGVEVELWTIADGPHIPGPWVPAALDSFVDWLIGHPRD